MKIVIDLQGAQTSSRHRGIGRYVLSLVKAMYLNRRENEIFIVLNAFNLDTVEPIRVFFDGVVPQENILVWSGVGPVKEKHVKNQFNRKVSRILREAFILKLKPDVLYIASFFEGFVDDAITSLLTVQACVPTVVTLFDLIPAMNPDSYLKPDELYAKHYVTKLDEYQRADMWLGISRSACQEGVDVLGLPSEYVINISAAINDSCRKIDLNPEKAQRILNKFGFIRPFIMVAGATDSRKNHRALISAFSQLNTDIRSGYHLAIVGKLHPGDYEIFKSFAGSLGLADDELIITDQVTDDEMIYLYNMCHVAVSPSIHEGFGLPALEAMACGAPLIASNTSSLPEVVGNPDALFDPYDVTSIHDKLFEVLTDNDFRNQLIHMGLLQAKNFSWEASAKSALNAIESLHKRKTISTSLKSQFCGIENIRNNLIDNLAQEFSGEPVNESEHRLVIDVARAINENHAGHKFKQLLVDISELAHRDHKTGIQRVVRSILSELLLSVPAGYSVRPVYGNNEGEYYYADSFACDILNRDSFGQSDEPIDYRAGDVFIGLDLQHHVALSSRSLYLKMRSKGVSVYFVIYDLSPILHPAYFPDGTPQIHAEWLKVLAELDGVLCISRAVADEFFHWLQFGGPQRGRPLNVGWFHLGADLIGSVPSKGLPNNSSQIIASLVGQPSVLMVGTIEPRKGYVQALNSFELLWAQNVKVNLVFVGKAGWKMESLIERIQNHPELNKRLFWLNGISDEFLESVYASSVCLLAASEGEGFGLPLIEAAHYQIPIIARDIPVFREVAEDNAFYFSGLTAESLAGAVKEWLSLFKHGSIKSSNKMKCLTWAESTQQLLDVCLNGNWYRQWQPDGVARYSATDIRFGSATGLRQGLSLVTSAQDGCLIHGPYIELPQGDYLVELYGVGLNHDDVTAKMDAAVDHGHQVLGEIIFSTKKAIAGLTRLARLFVTLPNATDNFEVRVWVNASTELQVDYIEIHTCDFVESSEGVTVDEEDLISEIDSDASVVGIDGAAKVLNAGFVKSFSGVVSINSSDIFMGSIEGNANTADSAEEMIFNSRVAEVDSTSEMRSSAQEVILTELGELLSARPAPNKPSAKQKANRKAKRPKRR